MKKTEDNENVILTMTKEEAAELEKTLTCIDTELKIVVKAGHGTEAITDTDSTICETCIDGLKGLRETLAHNPMTDLAKKYAEPAVYKEGSEGYYELAGLDETEWPLFLDELARLNLTCTYNIVHDTFTIG